MERAEIDDIKVETDSVAHPSLIAGSVLFPEIKKQLRWRACNPLDGEATVEGVKVKGLVLYSLPDCDKVCGLLKNEAA